MVTHCGGREMGIFGVVVCLLFLSSFPLLCSVPFLLLPFFLSHGCSLNDGKLIFIGGVTNGNDLVAAYMRESGRFAPELVEFCLAMTDVGDRPQQYAQRTAA